MVAGTKLVIDWLHFIIFITNKIHSYNTSTTIRNVAKENRNVSDVLTQLSAL